MLSRREHASSELSARLGEQGFAAPLIELLIEELREERLLDDERYALQFVRARAERGQGPRRIRMQLSETGLSDGLITRALETAPDFHAIARALRRRRFGDEPPADWTERARQSRFLQYRGFSNDHIASAFGNSAGDEPDALDLSDAALSDDDTPP